ncbi:MAG: protein kinase [Polyangiaceae bacterium]
MPPALKKTNLLAPPSDFVGRSHELALVHDCLRRGRLVSVLGPPGAGKTRLAVEYTLRHGSAFLADAAGGIWLGELAEARTPSEVLGVMARALELPLGDDHTEDGARARIAAALRSRGPTLLVLDNFEQLVPVAVPLVEAWLLEVPELSVLVTSRTRLGISGELGIEISGLGLPEAGHEASGDAVELFVRRARAIRTSFAPTREERARIGELVTRLDGLPLAIELAGARMGVLGVNQLLDRLGQSLDLLRGRPGRGQTLRSTLDWSWNLLGPPQQTLLGQAAVFHGGFSLEAAEAVVDLSTHPGAPSLLDVLASLADASLLGSAPVPELAGEVRFSLLDTIQRYAFDKLTASGELAAALERHARYFVRAASGWADEVEKEPSSLARLALEQPNLVAIHRRALEGEHPTDELLTQALAVTLALEPVFYMRGPTVPCLEMLDRVFEHVLDGVDPRLVALALKAKGRALRDLGLAQESLEALERALDIARTHHDRSIEARVLGHLASTRQQLGDDAAAVELLDAAIEAARSAGDERSLGMLFAGRGAVLVRLGHLEQAAKDFDAALALDERVGNRYAAAAARAARGQLNRARGRREASRADLEGAIAEYRAFGERRHEAQALGELGVLEQELGEYDAARRSFESAELHQRELGSRWFQASTRSKLGDLERELGRLEDARRSYVEALRIAEELGDRPLSVRLSSSLGAVLADLSRTDAARELLSSAEELCGSVEDPSLMRLLEIERAHLDLDAARQAAHAADGDAHSRALEAARGRLAAAHAMSTPLAERPDAERLALRLLERALSGDHSVSNPELTPSHTEPQLAIGRYELLCRIGTGGMATVWVGRALGEGGPERVVAIKRMHRHLAALPELALAFRNEARILSLVRHPNVVGIHDAYESGGEHLLVMDYVDGTSLFELVRDAALAHVGIPRSVAIYIVARALRGLAAAHARTDADGTPLGIVHRDATPHNILLGADGTVAISDFGIARFRQADAGDHEAKGKFRYMAPEQARSEDVDARADVFALGVVAWELLGGRRLFGSEGADEVRARIEAGERPPALPVERGVDAELSAIVARALEPEREARYASALEFGRALESWANTSGEVAREADVSRFIEQVSGVTLSARRRMLSQALERARRRSRASEPAAQARNESSQAIQVAASGRWFALPGAEPVQLQRRRALSRILRVLLERRLAAPNTALTQAELLEAGWPGEKVKHEAGALRVYNALSTLRKLGLRSVLASRDDGYLLDPKVQFERGDDA